MTNKINIFLDSNALYSDPLFKTSFGKLLLHLSKNNKIDLFISNVVYEESKNNFQKEIRNNIDSINKSQQRIKTLLNYLPKLPALSIKELESQFLTFYDQGFETDQFKMVGYSNVHLEELIRRSIKRIAPFSENRQEFRDAVIWLSYLNYIKENKLKENFFITNNKKDFWNSEKTDLHSELRKEIEDLKVYPSIPEFCSKEKSLLKIKGERDFVEWVSKNNLDAQIVTDLILSEYWPTIKEKIRNSINTSNPEKYFELDKYVYFEYQYSKTGATVDNLDVRQITNFAFISLILNLEGFGLFYFKRDVYYKEKKEIQISLKMTFNLKINYKISEIKIDAIKIRLKE